jgi:hypothetical protein
MFSSLALPSSRLFQFFFPPIQPHAIVEEIMKALDAQESRTIRMPSYTQLARFTNPGAALVPRWARDGAQWVSTGRFVRAQLRSAL